MDVPVLHCPKFLELIGEFMERLPDPPAIEAVLVAPDEIPHPERELLVHNRDMTSTLQRYHGEPIVLRLLDYRLVGDCYLRNVVLETAREQRPAEFGAIRIHLPFLGDPAQAEVLAASTPLGAVLKRHGIAYRCCPGAFFKIFSNRWIAQALRMEAAQWLYGRCNCLGDGAGRTLAEVIEVLPPEHRRARSAAQRLADCDTVSGVP